LNIKRAEVCYTGADMIPNAFAGKATQPSEAELAGALGPVKAVWDQLLAELAQDCNLVAQEWNSSSRKAGWALRLKRGERNIVYLSPGRDCFMASFALGDKAVRAARAGKLPQAVIDVIDQARRYAEGTAVRLDVRTPRQIAAIKKLVAIKLEN
jgi:hypothetical protein